MSEKVLGILRAKRWVFSIRPYVSEFLLFTLDRLIVVRQSAKLPYYTLGATHTDATGILAELLKTVKVEEILKSDKHNFAIPNSEITKIELTKSCGEADAVYPRGYTGSNIDKLRWSLKWINLDVITSRKKYKWNDLDIPEKKDVELEDYENMLRPVFDDKLSVKTVWVKDLGDSFF